MVTLDMVACINLYLYVGPFSLLSVYTIEGYKHIYQITL